MSACDSFIGSFRRAETWSSSSCQLYQFRRAKTAVTIVFYSENDLDNIPGLAVHSSASKQGRKGQIALKLSLKIPAKYNLDNWIFHTITTGLEECQE